MAKNWTAAEAFKVCHEGTDLVAIQDIGKRFPFVLLFGSKMNDAAIEMLSVLPEHITARKMDKLFRAANGLKSGDVDEETEETEVEEKPAKKKDKKEKAEKKVEKKAKKVVEPDDDEDEDDEDEEPAPKKKAKKAEKPAKKAKKVVGDDDDDNDDDFDFDED